MRSRLAPGDLSSHADSRPHCEDTVQAVLTTVFCYSLTGAWSAKRTISADPEVRRRVETAFRKFRADVMRKQIEDLEKNTGGEPGSDKLLFE
jgi:hypothetical protein